VAGRISFQPRVAAKLIHKFSYALINKINKILQLSAKRLLFLKVNRNIVVEIVWKTKRPPDHRANRKDNRKRKEGAEAQKGSFPLTVCV